MRKTLNYVNVIAMLAATVLGGGHLQAAVGDVVHQITVPVSGAVTFCSIGLAFDGTSLYYTRCGDTNIYRIDPTTGMLQATFNTGIAERPNALAFDATRNGIWIGAQSCNVTGMPIYFWDFDDNSVVPVFNIPFGLINPATGQPFLLFCFTDGLSFNANNPADGADDEIWFSDDVNGNIGLFQANGTLVNGYDGSTVDPSLAFTSGLAIGGANLYMANNGGGDVFRADKFSDPLMLVDQFTSGDERQEDMECDPVTFAPTEVMWVRTTPQGGQFADVVTAFEIEPGTCGLGGLEPGAEGRMTGGGRVNASDGTKVTHGFELHCDADSSPNRLQVNWNQGDRFHLEELTFAVCIDDPTIDPAAPPAEFDTFRGSGTGRFNGVSGATAEWVLTDAGEPGSADFLQITVRSSSGAIVLSASGFLEQGNHQAHR